MKAQVILLQAAVSHIRMSWRDALGRQLPQTTSWRSGTGCLRAGSLGGFPVVLSSNPVAQNSARVAYLGYPGYFESRLAFRVETHVWESVRRLAVARFTRRSHAMEKAQSH